MLKSTKLGPVRRFDLARTLAGKGRYWTTAYLVDGLLIDTGCAHSAAELTTTLANERVERIVNTHSHEDHIGANGPLHRQHPDIEIHAHPLGMPVLADPRAMQPLHPYRRLMWGWPEPSTASPLDDGAVVKTPRHAFTVIHTPGHSQDHLCLFEADRGWLFTGDLYVGGKDRALGAGYDVWQIIASLKAVRDLPIATLFPGSARVPADPIQALTAKIDHLEHLGEQVLDLDRRGNGVNRIVHELCGPPMWIEILTLGHFSRRNLVLSYLGRNQGQDNRSDG